MYLLLNGVNRVNKTYEIEYHIDGGEPVYRDVVTVDGRSARENRTPTCLITHAEQQARLWRAYRYEIRLIKLPHITATGVQNGVTHLVYTGRVDENC